MRWPGRDARRVGACVVLAGAVFGSGVAAGRGVGESTSASGDGLVATAPDTLAAAPSSTPAEAPPSQLEPIAVPASLDAASAAATSSSVVPATTIAAPKRPLATSPAVRARGGAPGGPFRLEPAGPADGAVKNPVVRWEREAGAGAPVALLLGDSLTYGIGKHGKAQLEAVAGVTLRVDAQVSRATDTAPAILARDGVASADIVLVALGTNDGPARDRYAQRIADVLAALPARVRTVIWIMPARWSASMEPIRARLVEAAQRDTRLVLVDWDVTLRAHPEWKADDGIHLTKAGYAGRGAAYAEALAAVLGPGSQGRDGSSPTSTTTSSSAPSTTTTTTAPSTTSTTASGPLP